METSEKETTKEIMSVKGESWLHEREPRGVFGGIPVSPTAEGKSERFWASIGVPQYAGKYAPFDMPVGYKIKSIEEVNSSLEITFEPTEGKPTEVWAPTQLFGPKIRYYSEKTGEWFEQIGYGPNAPIVKTVLGLEPSPHEAAAIGGLSLVTTIAMPTLIPKLAIFAGASIGIAEGLKLATTGKHLEPMEAISAAGIGELVGLGAMPLAGKLGSAWRGSRGESWLIKHSERYAAHATKDITPMIVDVPDTQMIAARTMSEKVLGLKLTSEGAPLGIAGIEAERVALSFADVPRTALLDPMVSTVTEQILTRELFTHGAFPFMDVAAKLGSNLGSMAVVAGLGLTLAPKLLVPSREVAEPYLLQKLRLGPILEQPTKQRMRELVIPTLAYRTEQLGKLDQSLKQITEQITTQVQTLKFDWPTLQRTKTVFPELRIPEFKFPFKTSARKAKRGAWFKRTHPIPSYKQVAKHFGAW